MAHWFENLTKTFADDTVSRRQAIRRATGIVAGVVLGTWLPAQALAQGEAEKSCQNPGTCTGGFHNCGSDPNCFCFQAQNTPVIQGVCGCNNVCAEPCYGNHHCATGYVCIYNTGCGCNSGACVAKCGFAGKMCPPPRSLQPGERMIVHL